METSHSIDVDARETGSRPAALYALLVLLTFQGLSGIAGGFGLVADPSGSSLGLPLDWLEGSIFANYFAPGIVLLTVLGVLPLLSVAGLWLRSDRSHIAAAALGALLLIWLVVEVAVIGYQPWPPFQAVYSVVGIAIISLALTPAVRNAVRPSA